ATADQLKTVEAEVFSKQGELSIISKSLGGLDVEQRKSLGAALNAVRTELQELAANRRRDLEGAETAARLEAERIDLTEIVDPIPAGSLHLITRTQEELEDVFVGMGFTVAEGPEVETDWYNFEALNFPPGHP